MITNEQSTKNSLVRRVIETVTAYLTATNSIWITSLFLITGIMPFTHMMVDYEIQGILGFPSLRYLIYCATIPICFMGFGLILRTAAQWFRNDSEQLRLIRKGFDVTSTAFLLIGGFFMVHVLWPMSSDFEAYKYFIVCGVVAVIICIGLSYVNKGLMIAEEKLKYNIRLMFKFIINNGSDHAIDKEKYHEAYEEKVIKPMKL